MTTPEDIRAFQFTSLPKVISPGMHALIDWSLLAANFTAAYLFGRRNRVIGVSALMAGLLEGSNVVLTKFPGGIVRKLSFPAHGRIGLGNLPSIAALPTLMGFAKRRESLFFYGQVAFALLVISMTNFNARGEGDD